MRQAETDAQHLSRMDSLKGYAANAERQTRKLRNELSLTGDQAAKLEAQFRESKGLTDATQMASKYTEMREHILSAAGGYDALNKKQREMVDTLTKAEAPGRWRAWTSPILLTGLSALPSGGRMLCPAFAQKLMLSCKFGADRESALDNAGMQAELTTLNAGGFIQAAEAARKRAQFEMEMQVRERDASRAGGVSGWIQTQANKYERAQFEESLRLEAELDAARDAAQENERKSKSKFEGLGAGGDRIDAKLSKQINDRISALQRKNEASTLLNSGRFENIESARMAADMAAAYGGKLDSTSLAALRLFEEQTSLNKALERASANPLQDYIDALPTAEEATKNLKATLAQTTEEGLSDLFMGDFDPAAIVENLRRALAQTLAQRTMSMVLGPLGDPSGLSQGAMTAAPLITAAMVTGGQAAASMIAAAMAGQSIAGAAGAAGASGGFLSGVASFFGFSEGGYSDRPGMTAHAMPVAAFHNAPHFAEGTPNTSGIPAVLHDNEAVVPLSPGRKIPVELGGARRRWKQRRKHLPRWNRRQPADGRQDRRPGTGREGGQASGSPDPNRDGSAPCGSRPVRRTTDPPGAVTANEVHRKHR